MPLSKIQDIENQVVSNLGRRNLIINGAMQVAQRGTSSTFDSYRTVDRTRTNHGGASVTQSQQTLTSGSPYNEGFRYFLRVTNTSASSATSANMQFLQFIEAQNIAGSGWNYTSSSSNITFSCWVRSSLAGTYVFRLRTFDGTSYAYASKFTLLADTWTKITKTIPGNSNLQFDNNNESGLEVNITPHFGTNFTDSGFTDDAWGAYSSGSRSDDFDQNWCNTVNATFDTTAWQLEVGDSASEFEHRSFAEELSLCQRYFQKFLNSNRVDVHRQAGTSAGHYVSFLNEMRATPTLDLTRNSTVFGPVNTGAGSSGLDAANTSNKGTLLVIYTNGLPQQVGATITATAAAEL
tara:strand:+ start:917 stop:1966 length:1050 start_codon:yes stop_codon:yes gene_type:complete